MKDKSVATNNDSDLKLRIIKSAMEAFTKEGIKPVTMDRIARNLSISKRTLYETFEDKESLLLEGIQRYRAVSHAEMEQFARANDNVLKVILHFYGRKMNEISLINPRFFKDLHKYTSVVAFLRARRDSEETQSLAFLKRGVDQGIFRGDVNMEIMHKVMIKSMDHLVDEMDDQYSFPELFSTVIPIWIRGISTEKGREILDDFIANWDREASQREMDAFLRVYLSKSWCKNAEARQVFERQA